MERDNISSKLYIYSDSRRFELGHKVDVFKPTLFIELTQLELLKIINCLIKSHSYVLSDKLSSFLNKIALEYDDTIDYSRKLPKKNIEVDRHV